MAKRDKNGERKSEERATDAEAKDEKARVRRSRWASARSLAMWVLAALFFRSFVAEAFQIPSGSMIPTLQVGDRIFVNKFVYGLGIPLTDVKIGENIRPPRRGEVAVFKFPRDPKQDFVKRIVAVAGDTVEIKNDVLYVNGKAAPRERMDARPCAYEDYDEQQDKWERRTCEAWRETLDGHTYTTLHDPGMPPRSFIKTTVPQGSVFVLGDNRDNSNDSRYWGFVPIDYLRGKAMVVWWSFGGPDGLRMSRLGHVIE